jgi:hypothetical protein
MNTLQSREVRSPLTHAERQAISKQLERMLADPLFRNSKRFPILLRFVVEHTLNGHAAELKERTIGIEVFSRQPNYDTNADPIVRATAGEVRKRIAQYYQNPGHAGEARIHLSPGSYVPEFDFAPSEPVPASDTKISRPELYWWIAGLALGCFVAVVATLIPWRSPRALDIFWAPVLNSANTVLLCIGQRSFMATSEEPQKPPNPDIPVQPALPITISQLYYMGSQNVALDDAKTLGRLTGLLEAKGKNYRIVGESSATFTDLREGPVVLIGGFNNEWTLRLTGPLRFSFEKDGKTFWIRDRRNPSARNRAANYDMPYLRLAKDYAIISRVMDPTTGRIVVVAAGLTGYGTLAAGEFLSDPGYMEAVARQAPKHWESKNLQLVLATRVINGNSGPPEVVDRDYQ